MSCTTPAPNPAARKPLAYGSTRRNFSVASPFATTCCPVRLPRVTRVAGSQPIAAPIPRIPGHPIWTLTFMVHGQEHTQHIPKEWVEEARRRVAAGREFQDAIREVLAANAQLLILARKQRLAQPSTVPARVDSRSMRPGRFVCNGCSLRAATAGRSCRFPRECCTGRCSSANCCANRAFMGWRRWFARRREARCSSLSPLATTPSPTSPSGWMPTPPASRLVRW